jgi:DUF1680 family protein
VCALLCGCLAVAPCATALGATGAVPPQVQLFDLAQVRLADGPFKVAQETDAAYVRALEPDRLLAWFRKEAGLPQKGEVYGGWESAGVAGHTLGHYLSAVSQLYAATGDPEMRRRANYIVGELRACQAPHGNGYVAAIPDGTRIFAEIKRGEIKTDAGLNGGWVPWYTIHKELAGLLDANAYCHDADALAVATGLADWVGDEVAGLNHDQMQRMLEVEHGGMTEALANLYGVTGNARYLDLARRFRHDKVFLPLSQGRDILTGLHANTQIPKFVGYQRVYELTGDPDWAAAAGNFWTDVTRDRSWVIGGNSAHEYFFPPERFERLMTDTVGPESCNSYNMVKLTEHVFQYRPDAAVMDFYERVLFNHILGTVRPHQSGFAYYTSLSPNSYRTYSTEGVDFWCCAASGMESHARYGAAIYAHRGDDVLLVNLFIPSDLDWPGAGLKLEQRSAFPERGDSSLSFHLAAPKEMEVDVRVPAWAGPAGVSLTVNGVPQPATLTPDHYAAVRRQWRDGDVLRVEVPMALHVEMLPHSSDYGAVLYGPIVLAGELGDAGMRPADFAHQFMDLVKRLPASEVPVIVQPPGELPAHLRPVPGGPLAFQSDGLVKPRDLRFVPFYRIVNERYNVYWHLMTPAAWQQEAAADAAVEADERRIEADTVDQVQPADDADEARHHFAGQGTHPGGFADTGVRDATDGGWFSYTLHVGSEQGPLQLACKYWGSDHGSKPFTISIDGVPIATETIAASRPGRFRYATYPIPAALTAGRADVTVRFQSVPGGIAGGVFGCRLVRLQR